MSPACSVAPPGSAHTPRGPSGRAVLVPGGRRQPALRPEPSIAPPRLGACVLEALACLPHPPALVPVHLSPRRPLSSVTANQSSGGNGTGTDPTERPTERPPRVSCTHNTFHRTGPGDVTCAAEQVYCPRPLRSPGGRSQKPAHRAGAPYPAASPTPHTPGPPALPACGSRFIVCSRLSGAVIGKIAGVEGVEHDGRTRVYIVSSLPQSR